MSSSHPAPLPTPTPAGRLTTWTAVAAMVGALGLTVAESAFGSADAAARAAIEVGSDTPCATP